MTIDGQQVGYQVTRFRDVQHAGQRCREARAKSELTVRRFGQETRQVMDIVSLETADGQLVRFSSTLSGGTSTLQTTGVREGDLLRLTTTTDGKSVSANLPLPSHCGGLFAVENSLLQQPLQSGESRTLQTLVPVLNVVGTVRLQAQGQELVELPTGARQLLRIDNELQLANGQAIQSQMWMDRDGQILRSDIPALRQVSYRADRQSIAQESRLPALDLGEFSLVRVNQALADPHRTQRIRYRAQLSAGDPCRVFPTTATQTVRGIDDRTAEIVVTAMPPQAPTGDSAVRLPEQRDLLPSAMIQSDDPAVQELARRCADPQADPITVARAIERLVHDTVSQKDFTTAFATAADVARTRQGDCTEHAVLTAALCRARGIPARLLVGLVYVAGEQAFAFHMWNEVWIGDRWLPLDATLGQGGVGAAHLTLGSSALDAGASFTSFLPVIQVLGQLKLEILEIQ